MRSKISPTRSSISSGDGRGGYVAPSSSPADARREWGWDGMTDSRRGEASERAQPGSPFLFLFLISFIIFRGFYLFTSSYQIYKLSNNMYSKNIFK
jgi:hypothetical protein